VKHYILKASSAPNLRQGKHLTWCTSWIKVFSVTGPVIEDSSISGVPHLTMEANLASKMLCFIKKLDNEKRPKKEDYVSHSISQLVNDISN
jgi:hypothetical protein